MHTRIYIYMYMYTRSVRAFGINLPLCDSQPIFFFRFFTLPFPPSFPFFLRFFRFSSSFSFSARTRFLPLLLLRPIPSFPFDKSLPEIPTKNHVARSCSRYSIGGYRTVAILLNRFLLLSLSPFSKRCTIQFSRKIFFFFFFFFCVSSSVFSPLFHSCSLMNHKFGGARREARAASCNASQNRGPFVRSIYLSVNNYTLRRCE